MKNETCHGGKFSKERLTILLAANASGTERFKPLVIGKFAKPRAFKNVKSLPVDYRSNKKAWMNSDLFANWLLDVDKKMKREKRNILMLIDNCPAHNTIPKMKNVTVKFLPPNTTSMLQPLDQGIIKNFKTFYRAEVVKTMLTNLDNGVKTNIDVLQAIHMTTKAWNSVSEATIRNCFLHCGIMDTSVTTTPETGINNNIVEFQKEWEDLNSRMLVQSQISLDEFVNIDNSALVCGHLSEAEIIESVCGENIENLSDEDDEELSDKTVKKVSEKSVRLALSSVQAYIESTDDVPDEIFSNISSLEFFVEQCVVKNKSQKKITDFFAKN